MRFNTILSAIVFFAILPSAQLSMADDSAIGTMAKIMISLKHFPSDSDKQMLTAIGKSSDSSEAEIAVAAAIANIEHQATAADKEKLSAIVADESTPAELRNLASIILNTMHSPSASEIAKLEKIATEI